MVSSKHVYKSFNNITTCKYKELMSKYSVKMHYR